MPPSKHGLDQLQIQGANALMPPEAVPMQTEPHAKGTARRSRNQSRKWSGSDRIMAGQNHGILQVNILLKTESLTQRAQRKEGITLRQSQGKWPRERTSRLRPLNLPEPNRIARQPGIHSFGRREPGCCRLTRQ